MKKYLTKNKWLIFALIVLSIFDTSVISGIPIITKYFIDYIPSLNTSLIILFISLYIGDVLLILFFEYFVKIVSAKLYRNISLTIKEDLFKKIFELPYKEFYKNDSDYYLNIFINDVEIVYADYFDSLFCFILSAIGLVIYSVCALFINYIVALVIIVSSLLTLIIPKLVGKKLSSKRKEQSDSTQVYMASLKDMLQGFTLHNKYTHKSFDGVHFFYNKNREDKLYAFNKYKSFVNIFGGFSLYLVNIFTFTCGILLINANMIALSSFVAVLSYVELIVSPSRDITYQIIGINSSKDIRRKIEGILNSHFEKEEYEIQDLQKDIVFDNVSFSYDEENTVLDSISLKFELGKKYAIVGQSGTGKTTLVNLLLGRLTSTNGKVTYDGHNIEKVDVDKICANINQNTFIFNTSAMNNITLFGSYNANNIDDLIKAIKAENILRDDIGEFGSKLSGGEKRKIDILRNVVKKSKVFIGDEMFDSIDKKSANEIKEFLNNEYKNSIWIEITHDISADNLSRFDKILVTKSSHVSVLDCKTDNINEIINLL